MTDSSLLSWKIWTCAACKVKKRSPSCTMVQNCERWHTCACRVGGSGSSLELISFWTISRYFPHMEKLWEKKLKTVSVALFPNIGHIWRKCGKQSVLDNFSDIGHIWRKCQRKLQTSSTRPFNHTWKKIWLPHEFCHAICDFRLSIGGVNSDHHVNSVFDGWWLQRALQEYIGI